MIKETKEFKDFTGVVEDSGGNVRYATKNTDSNTCIKIEDQPD